MDFLHWLSHNWFETLERLSLATGLFLSAYNTRIDWKSRHFSSQIEINKAHREIWSEYANSPALKRVKLSRVDLVAHPVTQAETDFVVKLMNHLALVRSGIKLKMYVAPEKLSEDISQFFALPIPRAVWNSTRHFQDRTFIEFVEKHFQP